jgi:Barrel-sandwich domain of CusB or HlyD membrane-fusion
MADLSKVRMRAFVNETDIGNVKAGQTATVTVDAFPNRKFVGIVEQVQPEAVVQSSVTMFPVLVSLDNSDGALMPGMNGEVVMDILRKDNVLAVPSDAIRIARDAATVAPVLGVSPDSLKAAQAAARTARGSGAGGTASSTASSRDAQRGWHTGRGAGYCFIDCPTRWWWCWWWRWRWWCGGWSSRRNRPDWRRDVRVREEEWQLLATRGSRGSQRFRLHRGPERRTGRRTGGTPWTRSIGGPTGAASGPREGRGGWWTPANHHSRGRWRGRRRSGRRGRRWRSSWWRWRTATWYMRR